MTTRIEDINDEDKHVLNSIPELGLISIVDGQCKNIIPPLLNIYANPSVVSDTTRWDDTVRYLNDYARYHDDFGGTFFLCTYDGWRECSEYCPVSLRKHVEWTSMMDDDKKYFHGYGNIGEPRFIHHHSDISLYPDMPHKVLAYDRHKDDTSVLLLPDAEFIKNQFTPFTDQVKQNDILWNNKKIDNVVLWRGSRNIPSIDINVPLWNGHGETRIHIRELAIRKSHYIPDLDAAYERMSIKNQLQYKYILDLDGMVNAWSGLYWKLYSNSLVFKVQSIWEQWYYPLLIPNVHYIDVPTLYDLPYYHEWCRHHDETCQKISEKATSLVSLLTYDFAIKDYKIH